MYIALCVVLCYVFCWLVYLHSKLFHNVCNYFVLSEAMAAWYLWPLKSLRVWNILRWATSSIETWLPAIALLVKTSRSKSLIWELATISTHKNIQLWLAKCFCRSDGWPGNPFYWWALVNHNLTAWSNQLKQLHQLQIELLINLLLILHISNNVYSILGVGHSPGTFSSDIQCHTQLCIRSGTISAVGIKAMIMSLRARSIG